MPFRLKDGINLTNGNFWHGAKSRLASPKRPVPIPFFPQPLEPTKRTQQPHQTKLPLQPDLGMPHEKGAFTTYKAGPNTLIPTFRSPNQSRGFPQKAQEVPGNRQIWPKLLPRRVHRLGEEGVGLEALQLGLQLPAPLLRPQHLLPDRAGAAKGGRAASGQALELELQLRPLRLVAVDLLLAK